MDNQIGKVVPVQTTTVYVLKTVLTNPNLWEPLEWEAIEKNDAVVRVRETDWYAEEKFVIRTYARHSLKFRIFDTRQERTDHWLSKLDQRKRDLQAELDAVKGQISILETVKNHGG